MGQTEGNGLKVENRPDSKKKTPVKRKLAPTSLKSVDKPADKPAPTLSRLYDALSLVDNVLEPLPMAMMAVDQNSRIVLTNTRLLKLFGFARNDLLRENSQKLLPGVFIKSGFDDLRQPFARLLGKDGKALKEFTGRKKGGVRVPLQTLVFPRQFGEGLLVFIVMLDMAEAKKTRHQLKQRDDLLRLVLSGMPAMVSAKDKDGKYLLLNEYQAETFGVSPDAAIGKTTVDLIGEAAGQEVDALDKRLREGEGSFFSLEENIPDHTGRDRVWLTTKSALKDENGKVDKIFSVSLDITEKKVLEERAENMVNFDGLTGLPNRPILLRRLQEMLGHAKRSKTGVALILFELDNMDEITAVEGEGVSDYLMRRAAIRLSAKLKENDILARAGNHAFAVLMTDLTRAEQAELMAMGLSGNLGEPFHFRGHDICLTVSTGVAVSPDDGKTEYELMQGAEIAVNRMRAEQSHGLGAMQASMVDRQRRKKIQDDLEQALNHGHFELRFQPEFDLETGLVSKAEALLRWKHPELGEIAPQEFLPIAESLDLMEKLNHWVLTRACEVASSWDGGLLHDLAISVNVSASQFYHDKLRDLVWQAIDKSGLPPGMLTLEIEESTVLRNRKVAAEVIAGLNDLGVSITLDKFGADTSSLTSLSDLRADCLKLDRHIFAERAEDPKVLKAIAGFGAALGKWVVASGIESDSQLAIARETGFVGAQGAFLSEPVNEEDLKNLVMKRPHEVS